MDNRLIVAATLVLMSFGCGDGTSSQQAPGEELADLGSIARDADDGAFSLDQGVADQGIDLAEPLPSTPPLPARCEDSGTRIVCDHKTVELKIGLRTRDVHFQTPPGQPPQGGWPVVLFFQGSLYSAEGAWTADTETPHGGYIQAKLLSALLDQGFAVIAPEVRGNGATFWDTNVPPYTLSWELAPDHDLMLALFDGIEDGLFGALDSSSMFATGISSGGYMTSRMAISYPGRFKALAVMAGSYATCSNIKCLIPSLPADHAPTLFLHGERDLIVPIFTMKRYAEKLEDQGTEVELMLNDDAGHEWIQGADLKIPQWFTAHLTAAHGGP